MTYTAHAVRWEHGWELHIEGVGVTQCRTLDKADTMIRDYLRIDGYGDWEEAAVTIIPDLGGVEDDVRHVRERLAAIDRERAEAAEESRAVVRELREAGLSVTDTAAVLGVSRGRVSQLTG